MKTRQEAIAFCSTLMDSYEDYPFEDSNWTVMRHRSNRKVFAWIFEKDDYIWINVKCNPDARDFWRSAYLSVVPGFHLNKEHWNSIILDESISDRDIETMIIDSYELTNPKKKLSESAKKK